MKKRFKKKNEPLTIGRMSGNFCSDCGSQLTVAEFWLNPDKCFPCIRTIGRVDKIRLCELNKGDIFKHPIFMHPLIVLCVEKNQFVCMDATRTLNGNYYRDISSDIFFGVLNQQWVERIKHHREGKQIPLFT